MALRFDLGPFEELHVGRCMIKNSRDRSLFIVEGNMPIVKGKEYMPEGAAQNVLEELYYCIQQMYLEEAPDKYQGLYLRLAAQSMKEDPQVTSDVKAADELIKAGDYYRALKSLRRRIRAEVFGSKITGPKADYVPRLNRLKA